MSDHIFTGSGVALITPIQSDGKVNYKVLEQLLEFHIAKGTDAIIACGTTGEAATLSEKEHCEVLSFVSEKVNGRIPVIAGTGSNDTSTAVMLSREAQKTGADACLCVTPYYNKTSQAGLVKHFNVIADSVDIPIILYNVPSRTGCNIQPKTYAELCKNPNIRAAKEASGDISQVALIRSLCGDSLDIYSGNDDQTVPFMSLGALGVISVFANICPEEMQYELLNIYNKVVIDKMSTPTIFNRILIDQEHFSGLSTYIKGTSPGVNETYYYNLAWATAIGF